MRIKNQFHINDFACSLALKQRLEANYKTAYSCLDFTKTQFTGLCSS